MATDLKAMTKIELFQKIDRDVEKSKSYFGSVSVIDDKVIGRAKTLLEHLLKQGVDGVTPKYICINHDNIQFEYEVDNKYFYIEVYGDRYGYGSHIETTDSLETCINLTNFLFLKK